MGEMSPLGLFEVNQGTLSENHLQNAFQAVFKSRSCTKGSCDEYYFITSTSSTPKDKGSLPHFHTDKFAKVFYEFLAIG